MTSSARPNLGGLFNGSTPPERPSSVNGRLGPRVAPSIDPGVEPTASAAIQNEPIGKAHRWSPFESFDPIRALELYFGILQAALDANRAFAIGVVTAVVGNGQRADRS